MKPNKAPKWSYDEWIAEQADKIASAINRHAMNGLYDGAIYVIPSRGATQGELVFCDEEPDEMLECLTFPAIGSRVSAIPRQQLYDRLWHACRRCPICPVE